MQRKPQVPLRARQWGKAGPIMALVSILVMAFLAKVTLGELGLTQQDAAAKSTIAATSKAAEVAGDSDDEDDAQPKATAEAPSHPANSLDKARAVQGLLDQQFAKTVSQIENEGK